jgi:uncharacterized membrane protein YdjX (TVP38/TMEM64 family)
MLIAAFSPAGLIGTTATLIDALRQLGVLGVLLYLLLQTLVASTGILPASILCIVAGAVYGLIPGFLMASASTLAASVVAFWLSRSVFRPWVEAAIAHSPRVSDLDRLIKRDGWKLVCLLRVSPLMPFAAASYTLGLSSISLRGYLIGTLAGLPALSGYVFLGTLSDAGVVAWSAGTGSLHLVMLGIGGLATLALTFRIGQWALRRAAVVGSVSRPGG